MGRGCFFLLLLGLSLAQNAYVERESYTGGGFCSTDAPTQPADGKQWKRIFTCKTPNYNFTGSVADIQNLAGAATQIRICNPDGRYVTSQPNTYPIINLRRGNTISFPTAGGYASQAVINANWIGDADLLAKMWNSCGSGTTIGTTLYWACNNGQGLHLINNYCEWTYSARTYQAISVWVDAVAPPAQDDSFCAGGGYEDTATRTSDNKQWTRILACKTPNYNIMGPALQDLAASATQIRICHPDGRYVTSNPNTYPIQNLQKGNTISFPPSGYATQDNIEATWTGPSELLGHMWNSCGSGTPVSNTMYWACNNQGGLHLTTNSGVYCEWTYNARTYQSISVWVDAVPAPYDTKFCSGDASGTVSDGKTWSRILNCQTPAYNLSSQVSQIQALATSASQIRICNPDGRYVTSNPNTYPIQNLRQGNTISFPPSGYATQANVDATWTGPSDLRARLWNSCGSGTTIANTLFWACNNQQGLHLTTNSGVYCEWAYASRTYQTISVWVDAVAPPPPPPAYGSGFCSSTSTQQTSEGKKWTQILSCKTPEWNEQSVDAIKALAATATQIRVCNPDGRFVTSQPNTYPILNLQKGSTISFPPSGYATTDNVAATWIGDSDLLARLWNSCGSDRGIGDGLYWACNNQHGLHLFSSSGVYCEWDYAARTYQKITVWVDSAPSSGGSYGSYGSGESSAPAGPGSAPPPPPPDAPASSPPASGYTKYGTY